jgi:glyoxylase-like metal-dependent hydrolase (beta-lactamase superfamily II)/ferredoxin
MARLADRLPSNAEGDVFVDSSCIDCEVCRIVAPSTFVRDDSVGQSIVTLQPKGEVERRRAAMALVACPTSSIGGKHLDVRAASHAFPDRIEGASYARSPHVRSDDVFFCGYASEDSYGAQSWLIVRPEGNVLVDSPRAAKPLLEEIEKLGGVRFMFLTHRDDVADHRVFRQTFGCERILHRRDVTSSTRDVERIVEGDDVVELAPDLRVVPTPGHTPGSSVLLHRNMHLFSGDHVWGDSEATGLHASRSVCWYSWKEQKKSMQRLIDFDFSWVLPGHGRPHRAPSVEAMRGELRDLVARM